MHSMCAGVAPISLTSSKWRASDFAVKCPITKLRWSSKNQDNPKTFAPTRLYHHNFCVFLFFAVVPFVF